MSTLPNSAVLFPDWKQEINRRVAAHRSARGVSQAARAASAPTHPLGASAAEAAARVAARFATAPSYSEMLAREARAAVDAAKAAAKAAEEAQAAFQFVLDGLEAGPVTPDWQLEARSEHALELAESSGHVGPELLPDVPGSATRSDPDRPAMNLAFREIEAAAEHDVVLPGVREAAAEPEGAVQPIYANLIEFPRPMVAARRARPRLAEGPLAAADSVPQLSIFEVEPAAISTLPTPATEDFSAPPSWMRTQWPESTADEWLPARDSDVMPLVRHSEPKASAEVVRDSLASTVVAEQDILDAQAWEDFTADFWSDNESVQQSAFAPRIESASLSRRLLAIVVDGALSASMLVLGALWAVPHVTQLPGIRAVALGATLAFLAAGFAYHACFFTFFRSTPGMLYAGIAIDTLSGSIPARGRRWLRLSAMLLSLLPLGLGFLWVLFDENSLAWHDRLSGTYLRRR